MYCGSLLAAHVKRGAVSPSRMQLVTTFPVGHEQLDALALSELLCMEMMHSMYFVVLYKLTD